MLNFLKSSWYESVCRVLTKHRYRAGTGYSEGITPTEYHYVCKICRKRFWSFKPFDGAPPQSDLRGGEVLDKLMKERPGDIWARRTELGKDEVVG